jgi:hypothetical protein
MLDVQLSDCVKLEFGFAVARTTIDNTKCGCDGGISAPTSSHAILQHTIPRQYHS